VVRLEGTVGGERKVVLGVSTNMRSEAENKFEQLRGLIGRVHGGNIKLELHRDGSVGQATPDPPAPEVLTDERVREAMADPLVKQAAEMFEARVVRVEERKER
jgi:hypothetical protein